MLGLISLSIGLLSGRRGYAMLAIYFACITLTYAALQPVPRYTYLLYGPLMFVALDGVARAWRAMKQAMPLLNVGRSAPGRAATDMPGA